MALTFSTGFNNYIASGSSWGKALQNGKINVYSGTQPTSANDASTGTLLCTFTTSGSAMTNETRAAAKLVIAGASGSIDSINIGGYPLMSAAVTFSADVATTMALVIANINANPRNNGFSAITGGGIVGGITYGVAGAGEFYIIAPKNSGTLYNAMICTTASTTLTVALNSDASPSVAESGGFAAVSGDSVSGFTAGVLCVNGLIMSYPAVLGLISKNGVWTDTSADATGTASWFRYLATPNYDDGTINLATTGTAPSYILRMDGSVGTSGSDMIISNTAIVITAAQTVNQFDLTVA